MLDLDLELEQKGRQNLPNGIRKVEGGQENKNHVGKSNGKKCVGLSDFTEELGPDQVQGQGSSRRQTRTINREEKTGLCDIIEAQLTNLGKG